MSENFLKVKKGVELKAQPSPAIGTGGELYYREEEGFSSNHSGYWDNFTSVSTLISQATISSSTFNTLLVENAIVNVVGSTASTIVGISPSAVGKRIAITNDTDQPMVLAYDSVTETDPNARLETPGQSDLTIAPFYAVELYYTGTKWKVISSSGAPSGGGMNVPVGAVLPFASDESELPDGFLLCDGAEVSRVQYSKLFAKIGIRHGSGDGTTTFRLPDYRGRFLRGYMPNIISTGSGTASGNQATFTAHGLETGMEVRLTSGALTGLNTTTTYFAIRVDANTLAFATNRTNAFNNVRIAISGANTALINQARDPDSRLQMNPGGETFAVGAIETDAMQRITGSINQIASMQTAVTKTGALSTSTTGSTDFAGSGTKGVNTINFDSSTSTGAKTSDWETRPKAAVVNYIICYDDDLTQPKVADYVMSSNTMDWSLSTTYYRESSSDISLLFTNSDNGMVKWLTVKAEQGLSPWAVSGLTDASNWQASAYDGSQIITLSSSGTASSQAISTDNGLTWTVSAVPSSGWNGLHYDSSANRLVAVGSEAAPSTDQVMVSLDNGATWNTKPFPAGSWQAIAYDGTTYVAVGIGTNRCMISNDGGDTWTVQSIQNYNWYGIVHDGTNFIAAGYTTSPTIQARISISPDGITWTEVAGLPSLNIGSISAGGGRIVAVGNNGAIFSTDGGASWTSASAPPPGISGGLDYGNGFFVKTNNSSAAFSKDGDVWTAMPIPEANPWRRVLAVPNRFVAVASSGTTRSMYADIVSNDINVTLPSGTIYQSSANLIVEAGKYSQFTLTKTNGKILATVMDNLEES